MSILLFKLENTDREVEIPLPGISNINTVMYRNSVLIRSNLAYGYMIVSVGNDASSVYTYQTHDDKGLLMVRAIRLLLKRMGYIELPMDVPVNSVLLRETKDKYLKDAITENNNYHIPRKNALEFAYSNLDYICSIPNTENGYCNDDNFWKEYYHIHYDRRKSVTVKPRSSWRESVSLLAKAQSKNVGELFAEAALQGNLSIISTEKYLKIMNDGGNALERILLIGIRNGRKNIVDFLLEEGVIIRGKIMKLEAIRLANDNGWNDVVDKLSEA